MIYTLNYVTTPNKTVDIDKAFVKDEGYSLTSVGNWVRRHYPDATSYQINVTIPHRTITKM
jgi:hypothetical protein